MKETKFRGISRDTGEMVFGWGCFTDESEHQFVITDKPFDRTYVRVEELSQFTGLHDAKLQEIYEGDIYKTPVAKVKKVIWDYNLLEELARHEKDIEVIGNVYENPELL